MRLAIVGGRDFDDYTLLEVWVDSVMSMQFDREDKVSIISGGAKGVDSLGEQYANNHKLGKVICKPNWDKYGKSAGFIRNQTIVDNCDMVLAFWDGQSRGTADTIEKAKKAKKPTFIIYYDKPIPVFAKPMKGM